MENRDNQKMIEKWKEKYKGKKPGKDQLLILLLVGVLFLVIAIPSGNSKKKETTVKEEAVTNGKTKISANSDEEDYAKILENRLKENLQTMAGVGKVEVMITLKASSEKVIEKDVDSTGNQIEETDKEGGTRNTNETKSTKTTVYTEGEEGEKNPYVRKELEPEILGVLVVAQGGGNAQTVKNISEAVQALFQIEAHKIKVMKMTK